MSGCQNYGPLLGPLNTTCRTILGTQKGTIILTTTHIPPLKSNLSCVSCWCGSSWSVHCSIAGPKRPVPSTTCSMKLQKASAWSLLQVDVSDVFRLSGTARQELPSNLHISQSFSPGSALCITSALCLVAAFVAEFCKLRCSLAHGGRKAVVMQGLMLLVLIISAVDMTILVPVIFDLSVQMNYGATMSGMVLGAHLASQPLGTVLGRLATSQSYAFQRRFMAIGFCVHAVLTWAVVPILGCSGLAGFGTMSLGQYSGEHGHIKDGQRILYGS